MLRADRGFWEKNDRCLSGEMTQGERILWVATMAVVGLGMLAVLWVCSR